MSQFKLIELWYSRRESRRQAEQWAAKKVTSAYAGMDMDSRAPDSFNRALGELVFRDSERLVKETILAMREKECEAFREAMPEIQKLADALERFKKGQLA